MSNVPTIYFDEKLDVATKTVERMAKTQIGTDTLSELRYLELVTFALHQETKKWIDILEGRKPVDVEIVESVRTVGSLDMADRIADEVETHELTEAEGDETLGVSYAVDY